jgi:hypothetical protein
MIQQANQRRTFSSLDQIWKQITQASGLYTWLERRRQYREIHVKVYIRSLTIKKNAVFGFIFHGDFSHV